MDDQKKTLSGEDSKSPVEIGAKVKEPINTTSGNNAQGESAAMTIKQEQKKVNEPSQEPETKDEAIQNEKVLVRLLNGYEFAFDRGITLTEIRVTVANKLDIFTPQVKTYNFSNGNLISSNMKSDEMPPIIFAIADPNFVFDDETWKEAIEQHSEATDIEGVRRILATIEGSVRAIVLLTEVFSVKIEKKREMTPCLETLLEAGADVNGPSELGVGMSIFYRACYYENLELVNRLLRAGANVHYKNNVDGGTCLMVASILGSHQVLERLLQAGSRVNDQNNRGFTSLHWACVGDHIDIVDLLLAAGANVNGEGTHAMTEIRPKTPLFIAQTFERDRIIDRLIRAGAKE